MNYPTPEYISSHPPTFKKSTVQTLKQWKMAWEGKVNNQKAIIDLHLKLNKNYNTKSKLIFNQPETRYRKIKNQIELKNHSIISFLHEFAHSIYGSSEKIACCWSIHLFAKTFPERIKDLAWKGHLLIYQPKT